MKEERGDKMKMREETEKEREDKMKKKIEERK